MSVCGVFVPLKPWFDHAHVPSSGVSKMAAECLKGTHPVVICAVDVSGHAKVPDLDHEVLTDQAVAGCQVPVDEVQRGQVDHPRGDLGRDVEHLWQRELPQRRQLGLLQDVGVRTVGPARSQNPSSVENLCTIGWCLPLFLVVF